MGARTARQVRPRYGRIAVAVTSTSVTALAVLGGVGVLPSAAEGPDQRPVLETVADTRGARETGEGTADTGGARTLQDTPRPPATPPPASRDFRTDPARAAGSSSARASSGCGWSGADDEVRHTYLVSGSVYDNLDPGTYEVYSRSEQAWGIDDSGSMKYFVRFAQGDNAAIGFHDIPIDDGERVQSVAELGTPLSHGCIRQRRADAKLLWAFAPLGTKVVVTA